MRRTDWSVPLRQIKFYAYLLLFSLNSRAAGHIGALGLRHSFLSDPVVEGYHETPQHFGVNFPSTDPFRSSLNGILGTSSLVVFSVFSALTFIGLQRFD